MPDVLPTINNEPAQGIQALLDTTYLWNPDVANELIEQINALLEKLDEVTNSIPPYSELEAPVKQYQPCYNGDNVYVAAADIETLPEQFNPSQWILIATKAPVLQAGAGIDINGNEISVEQQVLSDAAAGATAVQPEDLATVATSGSYNDLSNKPALGTAAYASTSDFATAAQGGKADTAVQPADLATVATSGNYTDLSNKPAIDGVTLTSQTTKADIGLAGVYKYKGSVATYADLANIQNPDVGDTYNVEDTGDNYAWSGTEWDQLGGTFVPPVTSVNSKTGAVVLDAKDVSAIPQVPELPTASASNLGNIVQYVGATTENYTNGYFYQVGFAGEEIMDGECDVNAETFQGGNDEEDLPPPTFTLDASVLNEYLESVSKPQITSSFVEIIVELNSQGNNVVWLYYNIDDEQGTRESVVVETSGGAISDVVSGLATLGFIVDLTGFTWLGVVDMILPTEDVIGWVQKDVQPEMNSIGVYKDDFELPEATEENVGTVYLVAGYESETGIPYNPVIYMSVQYIVSFIDGEAEVTGYGLTPETQPTDVMIDWATLESYLNSQETGFDWTNDTINISLVGENYLEVMYNADFSASAGVQTDGTVANIQQELENIGISVDLTGYTQFQFMLLKLPTEKGYENRQVPAFVPTSGPEETDYVLKTDGNGGAYWAAEAGGLPDQTGQSGKFLTTDGTDPSWATINALQNTSTGGASVTIEGVPTSEYSGTNVGKLSRAEGAGTTAYGWYAEARALGATAVGSGATVKDLGGIALGRGAETRDGGFVIALWDNQKHEYKICDLNGNIPSDRLKNAINKYSSMPTAASTNEGWIVQYTGTTDATYTHGYIYECVSDGGNPATYSWTRVDVQPTPVIPDPLPSQTGNGGKFLITNGTSASWGTTITQPLTFSNTTKDVVLTNTNISTFKIASSNGAEFVLDFALTGGIIPSGSYATYKNLGSSYSKWATVYTTKINNGADIAVPNTAGTMVVVDYTGATQGQVLTLNANNNAVWQTPSTAVTSTTATLVVANWSSNTQTITVNGVTSSNVVIVSPQPLSSGDYATAGVLCTAQNTNSLTFTCTQTPSNAIDLSIVIIG